MQSASKGETKSWGAMRNNRFATSRRTGRFPGCIREPGGLEGGGRVRDAESPGLLEREPSSAFNASIRRIARYSFQKRAKVRSFRSENVLVYTVFVPKTCRFSHFRNQSLTFGNRSRFFFQKRTRNPSFPRYKEAPGPGAMKTPCNGFSTPG